MAYTKTTWTETTGITPARLNNLETQYDKAMADAVTEAKQEIQYYVATTGNDSNAGTSVAPFKTIQKAVNMAYKAIAGRVRIDIAAGTYNENVDIDNMLCTYLYLRGTGTVNLNGYIDVRNCHQVSIYNFNITASNGIIALDVDEVKIDSTAITATATAFQSTRSGIISIDGCDLTGGVCINAATVGTLRVSNVDIVTSSSVAIILASGTFAYTSGLRGNIGSATVHDVSGSILIKGTSTITGGADTKSSGGQIFEQE